jgi:hypothetical protein
MPMDERAKKSSVKGSHFYLSITDLRCGEHLGPTDEYCVHLEREA